MTKAHVFVAHYGDADQVAQLVEHINSTTLYHAHLNDQGVPVIQMRTAELSDFFALAQADDKLNWIEYSVQVPS